MMRLPRGEVGDVRRPHRTPLPVRKIGGFSMHLARRTTLSAAFAATALALAALPAHAGPHIPQRTERASVDTHGRQADGPSGRPVLSANGRYVAFVSAAANLVPGDTNGVADAFVRDLRTGRTE